MSIALQYMPARICQEPYVDHAALWELAASVCQTVIELEETEPLLKPPQPASEASAVALKVRSDMARDYPFCDTSKCPWWRGYCSRDPACNN